MLESFDILKPNPQMHCHNELFQILLGAVCENTNVKISETSSDEL